MAMEFWGVEVKAGETLKVEPDVGLLLHLSQASLGESKKDKSNDSVVLYVNVDGQKLVIGTLSADKCPQISYDLVFDRDLELSHNWKHGSVYFCGYRAEMQQGSDDDEGMFDSESESEEEAEEVLAAVPVNGKPESKANKSKVLADKSKAAKPDSSKVNKTKPDDESEDDDSDDESDDSVEDESDDEDMLDGDESDEDDDEESSEEEEEEEETPKNAKKNKKRPAEPASKSPAPEKKAKLVTPQKSGGDGKKATPHTATPHPAKGGKTNTKADKSKQSPKSGGQVSCKACSKTFTSDGALQSHTKAKHSDAK